MNTYNPKREVEKPKSRTEQRAILLAAALDTQLSLSDHERCLRATGSTPGTVLVLMRAQSMIDALVKALR